VVEFWLGAALLVAVAAVFLLFPERFVRARRVNSQLDSNRDWYAQRRAELEQEAGDADPLLQDARLRILEEASAEQAGESAAPGAQLQPVWLLLPLLVLAVGLYWKLGASADVQLARELQTLDENSSEAEYRAVMLQVEDRVRQRPDNFYYQAMLGRFYMNQADYGRARQLYLDLAERAPDDAGALALAAQAGFLANDRELDADSQVLAERALAIDPHQRTALGLLGMVSYERGEYQAAINYWRRLIVMEDPASPSAQMIQGVIARAEAALAAGGGAAEEPHAVASTAPSQPAAATGLGLTVQLELPEGARAGAGDTVFVFARNPAVDSRMPVAVQRLTVAQLPVTLRLDDGNSMAGQKISELPEVLLVARVSPSGQPGESFATFLGELGPLPPDSGQTTHRLVLRPAAGGDS
jgi:cytochrome c-type biogenesis protein CcmH